TMTNTTLSPYEQARLDKIKRNEERLRSLGLIDAKKRVRAASATARKRQPSTPTKRTLRKNRAVTPSPARSSRRLKRKPVQYEPLMDDDESLRIVRKKFKEVKKKTRTTSSNFKCDVPMDVSSSPLTQKQKAVIGKKMEDDFLGKFEEYVTEVDTLSDQNRRNVLRQITKLAMGEGIRYESKAYGWPEGCYFLQGTKVGPTDDILKLMDIGRECEEEWGRDHGNGWLLSHPLKKLYQFQQYHLQD
ncbi:hypothetical protein ACHAXR_000401, partial [Thalassiosira sp. AJA248-18]